MGDNTESDPEDDIPLEETLLLCARRGQASIISDVLKSRKEGKIEVNINCKGNKMAKQRKYCIARPVKAKMNGVLYNQSSYITFDETSSYWSAPKSS